MKEEYVKTGRTNQKLETRSKILAGAQYFLNKGLEFNLEDIAKRTNISRATVYRYFSNIDILASEAVLDVSTKSSETLYENLKGKDLEENVLEIQDYYNELAINHEQLFRKYISVVLDSNTSTVKRGARRKKTLQLVLENADLTAKEKKDLANLLPIFMGMEPLIVAKDVCGLDNQESIELLRWGMKLMFKGLMSSVNSKQ